MAFSALVHGLLLTTLQAPPRLGARPAATEVHLTFADPAPQPARPDPQTDPRPATPPPEATRKREAPPATPTPAARPRVAAPAPAPRRTPKPHAPPPPAEPRTAAAPPTRAAPPAEPRPAPRAAGADRAASEPLQQRLRRRLELSLRHHFRYPPVARRFGWEGRVEVGLRVEPNGDLTGVHLVSTSGHGVLDQAALATVRRVARLPEAVDWLQGRHFDMVLPVQYRLVDG